MAPKFVAPYRMSGKRGKNDAADAAAICEAVTRPNMRFVPIKDIDQQAILCLHRTRQGFIEERTALYNRLRGLISEFGIVLPQKVERLRREIGARLEQLLAYSRPDMATARPQRQTASAHRALRRRLCRPVPKRCRGTAERGASRTGTTGSQPKRDQDPYRGRHRSKLQFPGVYDLDESRGENWKAVPECQTGRQITEEDQGETDGTDPEEPDRHPHGRHCGQCEPQPAWLGELLPLSELKSGDEQS